MGRLKQRAKLERYIDIKPYTDPEDGEKLYRLKLHVHHQQFELAYTAETHKDAEWMREMLVIALERIISEVAK